MIDDTLPTNRSEAITIFKINWFEMELLVERVKGDNGLFIEELKIQSDFILKALTPM